jgi:hypothetical protein
LPLFFGLLFIEGLFLRSSLDSAAGAKFVLFFLNAEGVICEIYLERLAPSTLKRG